MQKHFPKKFTFSVVITNFKKSGLIQPPPPFLLRERVKKLSSEVEVRLVRTIVVVVSVSDPGKNITDPDPT